MHSFFTSFQANHFVTAFWQRHMCSFDEFIVRTQLASKQAHIQTHAYRQTNKHTYKHTRTNKQAHFLGHQQHTCCLYAEQENRRRKSQQAHACEGTLGRCAGCPAYRQGNKYACARTPYLHTCIESLPATMPEHNLCVVTDFPNSQLAVIGFIFSYTESHVK